VYGQESCSENWTLCHGLWLKSREDVPLTQNVGLKGYYATEVPLMVPHLAMRGTLAVGTIPHKIGSWTAGSMSLKADYSRRSDSPSCMTYRLVGCGFVGTFYLEHVSEETGRKYLFLRGNLEAVR
jgi:hypothetical protein